MGRGIIRLANYISTDYIVQRAVSPGNKVIGAWRLGTTNVVVLTYEHADIPRNVLIFGEANPAKRYRKTIPACSNCDKVGHRTDVCPNPTTHNPACANHAGRQMSTFPTMSVQPAVCSVTALTSPEQGNVPSATQAQWTHHPDQYHRLVEMHARQTTTGPVHAQNDAAPPKATQLEGLIVLHPDLNPCPNLGPFQDPNELYNKEPPRNLGAAVRVHPR
ncbi:hypothetical protein MRX96_020880 [Rhipicephalus microplus]|uniref:Uncharacterized protein n=1 Tax=Rhipicephalus microplus TaxID=6941 RepID=A0A9J6E9J4_RHIMP|nr:hypothetical protein HPB51_011616 [Rhipicephalus microplus]